MSSSSANIVERLIPIAYGKMCAKCGKKNHFAAVCKSALAKAVHGIQSGFVEHPEESSDIGLTKNSLKKVKINNSVIFMQIDSGLEATILSKNLWNAMGQPSL